MNFVTLEELKALGQVNPNTLIHGDCLDAMTYISDKSVNMILADLPYGTTDCVWDSVIPFAPLWEQYKRIITDTGVIVLTASQPFTSALVMSNASMFKYEWIWEKNTGAGFIHAKNRPLKRHENILVFSKAPMGHITLLKDNRMNYNPQGLRKEKIIRNNGVSGTIIGHRPSHKDNLLSEYSNYPTTILNYKNDRGFHPTQKPVALGQYLIKTYTNEGELMLDNTCGSGSFLVSAMIENRNFIGIEQDSKYCEIARERLNDTYENTHNNLFF